MIYDSLRPSGFLILGDKESITFSRYEAYYEQIKVLLVDDQQENLNKSKDIPIIFVTAASHEKEHLFTTYSLRAIDYIVKPFTPQC
ncbi:hypothetical protein P7H19_19975 [Paenibacillus larvae]|nr:hypothetical protein [Paenibacillus larvae]MDT2238094.1 hypothetical protein [Paenibacillus larvae]